jgi:PHD/YefM family antitoxin component YafN of YafNO toxin-antitoxin module
MSNALNHIVPITRFNRGEANKIFEEVRATGCKIVLKNNEPTCVLITPERFQKMVDMMEDQYLLALAEEREKLDTGKRYSFEEILADDGLTLADIEAMEDVELE